MIVKHDPWYFFEMGYFFEQKIYIELPLALFSAFVELLHGFPIQYDSEFDKYIEYRVAEEDDKVEMFWPERPPIVLFENFISNIQLKGIFAIELQEDE